MKFGDKDYKLVPDRLKQFREENPRASIETEPTFNADGSITFKATIVKDQADEYSAKATGTARYTEAELKLKKAFEKLETISIGRSLSNLGYLNDGRIASTEEMDEFNDYKKTKVEEAIMELEACTTLDELKAKFLSLGNLMTETQVVQTKDRRKVELNASTAPRTK